MANDIKSYFQHNHTDSSIKTIGDFISSQSQIAYGLTARNLLLFSDESGIANHVYISNAIKDESKSEYSNFKSIFTNISVSSENQLKTIPLKIGTNIAVPTNQINRDLGFIETTQVENLTTFKSFYAKKLIDLLSSDLYVKNVRSKTGVGVIKETFPQISVWLWSRALSLNLDGSYSDTLINLSFFIDTLSISVNKNGGAFNFSLTPLIASFNDKWEIDSRFIKKLVRGGYVSEQHVLKKSNGKYLRNHIYFDKIISQNDVVFIKFEKLDIESKNNSFNNQLIIDKSAIEGQVFDMIGLVDSKPVSSSSTSNNLSMNIVGRDLVKLIIEDGVYFYPLQFISGGMFSNLGATNERITRFDGQIKSRFSSFNRTIESSMKFIMNALSTISICSDSLFESYKDKRVEAYQLTDDYVLEQSSKEKSQASRVIEIEKLINKSIVSDKLLKNLGYPKIQELSVYQTIVSFVDAMLDSKTNPAKDVNGELVGWSSFTFGGEVLKDNEITSKLSGLLFFQKTLWCGEGGVVIGNNDARIAYINKLKAESVKTSLELDKVLLTHLIQDKIERANKAKEKIIGFVDKTKTKAQQQVDQFTKDLFRQNEKKMQNFAVAESTVPVTGNSFVGLSDVQKQQKIEYDKLKNELDELERKSGAIYLVNINSNLSDVNESASKAIKEIYKIVKENRQQSLVKRELKTVRGIWQIVKFIVDESVSNRRIVDATIGNEQGSLVNAINKLCVDPFVEFSTDTYGDQFFFIVKKKPFDKESILSYINSNVAIENKVSLSGSKSIVIDIDESDILSMNLDYSNEHYSWYSLKPINMINGESDSMPFAYIKAIFLSEYAEIFGSKPYDSTTNYINFTSYSDVNSNKNIVTLIKQAIYDLKYLIESHAYLPFTRTGTITINGDRRIKRGTFIRVPSTGEIFYVDSVTNNFVSNESTIDRTTTINVSHGMVEKFIYGQKINGIDYSYFNIVNLHIDESVFTNQNSSFSDFNRTVTGNWKVNPEVFRFFVKNLQFLDAITLEEYLNPKIA